MRQLIAVFAILSLALTACGGSGATSVSQATAVATATSTPVVTPSPMPTIKSVTASEVVAKMRESVEGLTSVKSTFVGKGTVVASGQQSKRDQTIEQILQKPDRSYYSFEDRVAGTKSVTVIVGKDGWIGNGTSWSKMGGTPTALTLNFKQVLGVYETYLGRLNDLTVVENIDCGGKACLSLNGKFQFPGEAQTMSLLIDTKTYLPVKGSFVSVYTGDLKNESQHSWEYGTFEVKAPQ